jgi:lactate dehydrogenase-like 2-hydroxyacid dehydrogenase
MAFKHHIIALDSWVQVPDFSFPHTLTVITDGTALSNPSQLAEATIAINSQVPVNAALLEHMPKLQLFAATGTGVDHIDKQALRERGVVLCKVPAQNTGQFIFFHSCFVSVLDLVVDVVVAGVVLGELR